MLIFCLFLVGKLRQDENIKLLTFKIWDKTFLIKTLSEQKSFL